MVGRLPLAILPDLVTGEMTVGLGAGLNGDDCRWKCIFKVFLVESRKGFLQEFHSLGYRHGHISFLFALPSSDRVGRFTVTARRPFRLVLMEAYAPISFMTAASAAS